MTPEQLIRHCHDIAGVGNEAIADPDSLIGLFQTFRPDGAGAVNLFEDLEYGSALHARLEQLYATAGNDRRPGGGRDAYFVVRNPIPIDPAEVQQTCQEWLEGTREIAVAVGQDEIADLMTPTPKIRVLEGIPPKHPKAKAEKSHLLVTLHEKVPAMIEAIEAGPIPSVLRPAYYFTCCDAMLRDYLMWPFYVNSTGLTDPLAAYFKMWKHGVKYRVFAESQVDIYLPRLNS